MSLSLANLDALQDYFDDNGNFANPNAGEALAGVAGVESGGSPTVVNPSSGATGLFQDLGPRLSGLNSYLGSNNLTLASIPGQAQNALNELNGSESANLAVLNNPNASLQQTESSLISGFERPGAAGTVVDNSNLAGVNSQLEGGSQLQSVNATNDPVNNSYDPQTGQFDIPGGGAGTGANAGDTVAPPVYNSSGEPVDQSSQLSAGFENPGYVDTGNIGAVQGFQGNNTNIASNLGSASEVSQLGAAQSAATPDAGPEGGSTNIADTSAGSDIYGSLSVNDAQGASTSANAMAQDVPSAIDAQTNAAAQDTTAQDKSIAAAANTTAQAATSAAQANVAADTSITGSIEAWGQNLFVRAAFIIVGLLMLGAGLYYMFPAVQSTIQKTVAA